MNKIIKSFQKLKNEFDKETYYKLQSLIKEAYDQGYEKGRIDFAPFPFNYKVTKGECSCSPLLIHPKCLKCQFYMHAEGIAIWCDKLGVNKSMPTKPCKKWKKRSDE